MLTEIPCEQLVQALDDCANQILSETGIEAPPVDTLAIAQRLEMVVAEDASVDVRARFVRLGNARAGQETILLADDPRPERRHWAVAHEIGESVAHRVFASLGIGPELAPPSARERIANHLASCLLLPRNWFAADGPSVDWDLIELKQRYATASHELIARRMLGMSPPVIITMYDQSQFVWRRSNTLRRPPRQTDAERETRLAAFQRSQPAQYSQHDLPEGIEDVRCWAIHEPDWKREIMRTALVEAW